jgi:SAM-dependent methyltransferase
MDVKREESKSKPALPAAREYWDTVAEEWTANQRFALWRRHSDAINSALLHRWLPAQRVARLLKTDLFDEAVTQGLYPLLGEYADEVVGVDVSPGIVEAVKIRYPALKSRAADVRELPFADASFDVIVSLSTLDHFDSKQDIKTALNELTRVLRPGGHLLLTLDNLAHPAVWLRSILPQRLLLGLGLVPYRVGSTCRPRQLESYCRHSGLELECTTAVLHCPRALAVAGARLLRHASARTQHRYLKFLSLFEHLEHCPMRFLTGHFTAIHARKPRERQK